MIKCLNLVTLQQGLDTVQGIKIAAGAGFESVGIWADPMEAQPDPAQYAGELPQTCEQSGLTISEMCFVGGWMWGEQAAKEAALAQARARAELACAAGCPLIIACASGGVGDIEAAARDFRALCDIGYATDVSFALEYIGMFEQVKDLRTGLEIVRKANHPKGKLLIDTFHSFRGGSVVEDFSLPTGDEVGLVHINDVPQGDIMQMADSHRIMPGAGALPLKEALSRLADNGYEGAVSVEVFSQDWWDRPLEQTAKAAFEGLETVMPEG